MALVGADRAIRRADDAGRDQGTSLSGATPRIASVSLDMLSIVVNSVHDSLPLDV